MLTEWALRHNIPPLAMAELKAMFGVGTHDTGEKKGVSESAVQTNVQLEASRRGGRLFRNNVGAFKTETGSWVRYGLCNESKQVNARLKSSDLVGPMPIRIRPHHVGHTIAQFTVRECKPEGWVYTGKGREVAQLAFMRLVVSLGGDASFTTGRF